jgi:hypothetical protein
VNTWSALKLWFKQLQVILKGVTGDGNGNIVFPGTINGAPAGILLGAPVIYTTPGTFTYNASSALVKAVLIKGQGPGGGGAGAAATGAGQVSAGGPGGSGGYFEHYMSSGFNGTTVTISAAGTAGTAGGNGGNAGTNSFGAVSASGGNGGTVGAAGTNSFGQPGASGVGSGGNIINCTGPLGYLAIGFNSLGFITTGIPAPSSCMGSVGGGAIGAVNGSSSSAIVGHAGNLGGIWVYEFV